MNNTTTKPTISKAQVARMKRATRLTKDPIPKDLADRVDDKIIRARVQMLYHMPFFGTLAVRLKKIAADAWLETMATDGMYLYYNHAFVDALEQNELVFVLAHEVEHIVYGHVGRTKDLGLQPKLANIAQDYVINDDLIEANVGKFPTTVPGLHDVKYRGWSSEQVYDDLLKKQKTMSEDEFQKMIEDLLGQLLDEHLGVGDKDDESSEPTAAGPAQLSKGDREQMQNELKQEIVRAAQGAQADTLPAGIDRIVQQFTAPKIDWRGMLQTHLNSIIPADYSFMKMSRNSWYNDAIFPGVITEKQLELSVALDMSGSIGDKEVGEFLSEIKGIMDQYPNYKIQVMCFDTKIYNDQTFLSDNNDNICTYRPKGGGGTDASCIFEHLKEQSIQPSKLVIFTDGYVSNFGDSNYCDTVWVIKGSKVVPPFGSHAYFD